MTKEEMNKMKIIDLLNKIANGEEVPKKIKYRNKIFIYGKDCQCYIEVNYNKYNNLLMELSNHKGTDFNYEVEIVEDTPKEETNVSEEQVLFNNLTSIDQEYVIRIMKMLQQPKIDKINGE